MSALFYNVENDLCSPLWRMNVKSWNHQSWKGPPEISLVKLLTDCKKRLPLPWQWSPTSPWGASKQALLAWDRSLLKGCLTLLSFPHLASHLLLSTNISTSAATAKSPIYFQCLKKASLWPHPSSLLQTRHPRIPQVPTGNYFETNYLPSHPSLDTP